MSHDLEKEQKPVRSIRNWKVGYLVLDLLLDEIVKKFKKEDFDDDKRFQSVLSFAYQLTSSISGKEHNAIGKEIRDQVAEDELLDDVDRICAKFGKLIQEEDDE